MSANGKFVELIDIFAGDYFTFKKGDFNLGMIIKVLLNKPLLNGFFVIKDSEIEFYKTLIKDLNGKIIFDFDKIKIEDSLKAKGEDSGNIILRGSLPFYSKNNSGKEEITISKECSQEIQRICLKSENFNVKTDNINFLLDSEIYLSGAFQNPVLKDNLSLNIGLIDFYSTSNNNKINTKVNRKKIKIFAELFWDFKKNLK